MSTAARMCNLRFMATNIPTRILCIILINLITHSFLLLIFKGSRIGVVYVPNPIDSTKAEMHFIINGEDQGACTKDIPYKEGPLHAVVDVYGTTKQVKIIQLYGSKLNIIIITVLTTDFES